MLVLPLLPLWLVLLVIKNEPAIAQTETIQNPQKSQYKNLEDYGSDHIRRKRDVGEYLGNVKVDKGQLVKYLLVPALIMSGLVPYILPPIKMAVMFVSMMTNMAFTSALFTLVRSYIFDPRPEEENVVYYNYGYKKKAPKTPGLHGHGSEDFVIFYPGDVENEIGKKDVKVPVDVTVNAAETFEKTYVSDVPPSVYETVDLEQNQQDLYDYSGRFGEKVNGGGGSQGGYGENVVRRY